MQYFIPGSTGNMAEINGEYDTSILVGAVGAE